MGGKHVDIKATISMRVTVDEEAVRSKEIRYLQSRALEIEQVHVREAES